jgi:hypothetical protein
MTMRLNSWKRAFSLLLLMTILSSVGAADRACPQSSKAAAEEPAHHHGTDAPAHDSDMHCEMMLSCGSAVSMERATLIVLAASAISHDEVIAPHYTSPSILQKAPPPKVTA